MKWLSLFCLLASMTLTPVRGETPEIATFAGVRVGQDTLGVVNQRFGSPPIASQSAAYGAHEWRSRQTGWALYAAGSTENADGNRVVDSLLISVEASPGAIVTDLPRSEMRFLGKISLGMSRVQIERLIRAGLPPPNVRTRDRIIWKVPGSGAVGSKHISEWQTQLLFKNNVLRGIAINAEYD